MRMREFLDELVTWQVSRFAAVIDKVGSRRELDCFRETNDFRGVEASDQAESQLATD
jgi:hypothetical protein